MGVRVMQQRCRVHASIKELIRRQIAKEMNMLPWNPNSAVKEMRQVVAKKRGMVPVAKGKTTSGARHTPEVTQEAVAPADVQNEKAATAVTAAPLYSARTAKLIDEEKLAQKPDAPLRKIARLCSWSSTSPTSSLQKRPGRLPNCKPNSTRSLALPGNEQHCWML